MLVLVWLSGCLVDTELYESRKLDLSDGDGDGFARPDDCADTDASVFPGAQEVCDGKDQDCDERWRTCSSRQSTRSWMAPVASSV